MLNLIKKYKNYRRAYTETVYLMREISSNKEYIVICTPADMGARLTWSYEEEVVKEMTDMEAYNYWLNNDDVVLEGWR